MNRKVLMALLGCLAVVAMLGVPALVEASDGVMVLDVQNVLAMDTMLNERPESAVPLDPGIWVGDEYAVTKPKMYWVDINAEAAVPVDPGSVSFESSKDYSGSKLISVVVGVVGLSLYFGCRSLS